MRDCVHKVGWVSMKDRVPSGRRKFKPMDISPASFEVGRSLRELEGEVIHRLSDTCSMSTEYESVVDKIRKSIDYRTFPDDYLKGFRMVGEIAVETGSDIFMYRELEGINVVVDGKRTFFNDPYLAKYYYYASLMGFHKIALPEKENVRKVVRLLENELRASRGMIDESLSVLDEIGKRKAINELMHSDPYFRMAIYSES